MNATSSGGAPPLLDAGPKLFIMGDSGTGKTHVIKTLEGTGVTPFCIATEQNFLQVMKSDIAAKRIHYKYINPVPDTHNSFAQILDMAKKINQLSYENLCKVTDPFKQAHNRLLDVLTTCNDFVCDCCQKSWGGVLDWNTDRMLVIDSFSGTSDMAFGLVVGNKPVRSPPDYGVAQGALRMLLAPLTTQMRAGLAIMAHIDRVKDEITGGTTISIKTVGQALGPDLPRMFSDVIRSKREGKNFYWDTEDTSATVVARHIPIAGMQTPSLARVYEGWKKEGGVITATVSAT